MAAKGTVPMAAIVIGGTGATGKSLLRNLLQAKVDLAYNYWCTYM